MKSVREQIMVEIFYNHVTRVKGFKWLDPAFKSNCPVCYAPFWDNKWRIIEVQVKTRSGNTETAHAGYRTCGSCGNMVGSVDWFSDTVARDDLVQECEKVLGQLQ